MILFLFSSELNDFVLRSILTPYSLKSTALKRNILHLMDTICYNKKYISYIGKLMTLDELAKSIKTLRKEKNWSQQDLEDYSGITKRTISKIENGLSEEVGIKKVATILDLLGYEFSLRAKGRPKTLEELANERRDS